MTLGAAAIVGGVAGAGGGWYVYDFSGRSVVDKLVCIEKDPQPFAWMCGQLLRRHRFTPGEVAELNGVGGATFPLSLTDRAMAEEFLKLFLAHGVDVNAPTKPAGSTPLHMLIKEPDNVRLLLKHGAQPGIRDVTGETALDRAKRMVNKMRPDAGLQQTIQLLTEAASAPAASARQT